MAHKNSHVIAYHATLYLLGRGCHSVSVFNPAQIKAYASSHTRTKTAQIDR